MIVTKLPVSISAVPRARSRFPPSRWDVAMQGNKRAIAKKMPQHVLATHMEARHLHNNYTVRRHAGASNIFKAATTTTTASYRMNSSISWTCLKGNREQQKTRTSKLANLFVPIPRRRDRYTQRFFSAISAFVHNESKIDSLSSIDKEEDNLSASWKQMYDLLVAYHTEHGSTIVPDRCYEDKKNPTHLVEIGKWVKLQRQQSRFLSQHQKNLLNKLGFVWDHQEAQWLEKYERLCDYESKMPFEMSATEISNIRSSDLESVFEKRYQKDPVLRRWVNAQRQKYRSETISAKRVRLLEKVEGFVWDVKEARWFEMHRRLSLFAKHNNGSCIVPQHYSPDPQLACWVSNQRHRKHQLSAERINMLDALGFVWDVRELQWMINYENYKAMYFGGENNKMDKDSDGDDEECNVTKEEQQLIDWAIKQRRAKRNGTLSAYRKHLLDELVHPIEGHRFVWDPQGQNWMEMYEELKEYRNIHNHVMVPTRSTRYDDHIDDPHVGDENDDSDSTLLQSASTPTNRQLGVWVANQRRNFKKGTLSKKRKKLLDDIDFVWDAPEAMWNEQYKRLLDYQTKHIKEGKERSTSTVVPQHYPKDPQLAIWVKEQRQNRKNGILTGERLELLENISFVWDASSLPSSSPH